MNVLDGSQLNGPSRHLSRRYWRRWRRCDRLLYTSSILCSRNRLPQQFEKPIEIAGSPYEGDADVESNASMERGAKSKTDPQ